MCRSRGEPVVQIVEPWAWHFRGSSRSRRRAWLSLGRDTLADTLVGDHGRTPKALYGRCLPGQDLV
jgi:hypothetical protein